MKNILCKFYTRKRGKGRKKEEKEEKREKKERKGRKKNARIIHAAEELTRRP